MKDVQYFKENTSLLQRFFWFKTSNDAQPLLPDDPFNVIEGTWSCHQCGLK